jgi:8-oxo-dGTP pyrophosphatase MutT (NUDIX family)
VTEPESLTTLRRIVHTARAREPHAYSAPEGHGRRAGVLVLIGETGGVPDVLLTVRADRMRAHAGQVAFPGGSVDPQDDGPVAAALREAEEETGLDPDGVDVLDTFPELFIPVSGFAVTPVLGWWREAVPVAPTDPAEVVRVSRVPVPELADPAHRFRVRHPSGFEGPGFRVDGLFIWGFTAGLLDALLELAGWAHPWDENRWEDIPLPGSSTLQERNS